MAVIATLRIIVYPHVMMVRDVLTFMYKTVIANNREGTTCTCGYICPGVFLFAIKEDPIPEDHSTSLLLLCTINMCIYTRWDLLPKLGV